MTKITEWTVRIGVAMLAALAVASATSVDRTAAQLPSVDVPGVITVQPSQPSVTVTTPSLPSIEVTPPPVTVPQTPVTPPITVKPPSIRTPSVTLPQAPAIEAPQVKAPQVKAPQVTAPQVTAPQVRVPDSGVRTPSGTPLDRATGGGGQSGAGSTAGAGGGPGAGQPAGAGAGPVGGPAASSLAGFGVPTLASLAAASPAQRRLLLRRTWNRPLRGRQLRKLRRTVEQYQSCLGDLPRQGRRALRLRAGVGPGQPVSRRVVARRLGVSLPRALRVERTALRRLVHAGEQGRCGTGVAPSSVPAGSAGDAGPANAAGSAAGRGDAGNRSRLSAAGDSDAARNGRLRDRPQQLLDPDESGGDSPLTTLLFLFLALLVLALVALALRSLRGGAGRTDIDTADDAAAVPVVAAAPVVRRAATKRKRPLLFLYAGAVLALERNGPEPAAPSYLSARTREVVQQLAASFHVILVVDWRHDANRLGRVTLEDRELPLLTVRRGSADSTLRGVARVARDRPVAWIDEHFDERHEGWARDRSLPTLLIAADDASLAEQPLVELLEDWAERIAHGERPRQRLISQR